MDAVPIFGEAQTPPAAGRIRRIERAAGKRDVDDFPAYEADVLLAVCPAGTPYFGTQP